MDELKVGIVQMNSVENDKQTNIQKALAGIDAAADAGASLVVLPEFFNTEFFPQYWNYKYLDYGESDSGPTISAIAAKAAERKIVVVATIFEMEGPGVYFDTAVILGPDGKIIGKYRKTHPASTRSLESIYFKRGSKLAVWNLLGWKVGLLICYDLFHPEVARTLTVLGAELILAPFAHISEPIWLKMLATRAYENGVYLAVCNKVGREGTAPWAIFGGQSAIIDPFGEIVRLASGDSDETAVEIIARDKVTEARKRRLLLRDRRPELYRPLAEFEETARGLL
jgi:N-carbamoylputrescine amidase